MLLALSLSCQGTMSHLLRSCRSAEERGKHLGTNTVIINNSKRIWKCKICTISLHQAMQWLHSDADLMREFVVPYGAVVLSSIARCDTGGDAGRGREGTKKWRQVKAACKEAACKQRRRGGAAEGKEKLRYDLTTKGGLKSFFWTIGRLYEAGACTILRDAERGNAESVCWEVLLAWGLPKPAVALANRLSCCLHSGSSWAANFALIIVLIVKHGICCSESNNATGPQLLQCMSRQAAVQKRTLPSLQAGHIRNNCSCN